MCTRPQIPSPTLRKQTNQNLLSQKHLTGSQLGVEVSKAGQASGLWSMTATVRWLHLGRSAGVQQGMDSDRREWPQMAPSSVTVLGRCGNRVGLGGGDSSALGRMGTPCSLL